MATIGKYAIMVLIAFSLSIVAYFMNSDYLINFFSQNAIFLGCTMLTIYFSSIGILISQLSIIKNRIDFKFTNTIQEIRKSFLEIFIYLFFIMVCTLIVSHKDGSQLNYWQCKSIIIFFMSTSILFFIIAIIGVIYDAINAILKTFEHDTKE